MARMLSRRQVILKFILITDAKKYKLAYAQTCIFLHASVIKKIRITKASSNAFYAIYAFISII